MPSPNFNEGLRMAARELAREGMPAAVDRRLRQRFAEATAPRRHRSALLLAGFAVLAAAVTLWLLFTETGRDRPSATAPPLPRPVPAPTVEPLPAARAPSFPAEARDTAETPPAPPAPMEPPPSVPSPAMTPAPAPASERPHVRRTRAPQPVVDQGPTVPPPAAAAPPDTAAAPRDTAAAPPDTAATPATTAPADTTAPAAAPPDRAAQAARELEIILRVINEQRSRGQYREAAATIESTLARPGISGIGREILSFELASILAHQLGSSARACTALADYARDYPHGRYAADVAREQLRLDCPRR